jgi:hypothetical protein
MVSPQFNYWVRIDLTVKSLDDGVSTKIYSFLSAPSKSEADRYWELLSTIDELTHSMGDHLPSISGGSFTIRNTIGSFGAYRKFSDVLARYTPVDQLIVVYVNSSDNTSVNTTTGSWSEVLRGKCQDFAETIADDSTITFNVQTGVIKDQIITAQGSESQPTFLTGPTTSFGSIVPLVIGSNVAVKPIRVSSDGANGYTNGWPKYVYGATLKGFVKNAGFVQAYSKNYLDEWEPFVSGGVFNDWTATASSGTPYALNQYASRAVECTRSGGSAGVVNGFQIQCVANGTTGRVSTAQLTVFLLRFNTNTQNVEEEVGSVTIALSSYNSSNNLGTGGFAIFGWFPKPIFCSAVGPAARYALGWSVTGYAAGELTIEHVNVPGDDDGEFMFLKENGSSDGSSQAWKITRGNEIKARLFGVTFSESTESADFTSDGFAFSTLTMTPEAATFFTPNFNDFPLLITVNGLSDDASGTVSGTPNLRLERPDMLINVLQRNWNGSAWVDSNAWDLTSRFIAYAAAFVGTERRTRVLKGRIDSRTTFVDFLEQICKETACRIGLDITGKLFLLPWGQNQQSVMTISESDITPVDWTVGDSTTVINRVYLNYNRSYLGPPTGNGFGKTASYLDPNSEYQSTLDWDYVTNSWTSLLSTKSFNLFGRKVLENEKLDYIGSQTGAETYAEFLTATKDTPPVYATFIVPYHKYSGVKLLDVVRFGHTRFPNIMGSNPEASEPVDNAGNAANLLQGYEWSQSVTYRGQVEAKGYILPFDNAPAIRIKVRVLTNSYTDPT